MFFWWVMLGLGICMSIRLKGFNRGCWLVQIGFYSALLLIWYVPSNVVAKHYTELAKQSVQCEKSK